MRKLYIQLLSALTLVLGMAGSAMAQTVYDFTFYSDGVNAPLNSNTYEVQLTVDNNLNPKNGDYNVMSIDKLVVNGVTQAPVQYFQGQVLDQNLYSFMFNYSRGSKDFSNQFWANTIPGGSVTGLNQITGKGVPDNNYYINSYINTYGNEVPIDTFATTATAGGGTAPEMDGSLAPKVAFLLGCLFLIFGSRRGRNTSLAV